MKKYQLKDAREYIVRRATENDIDGLLHVLLEVAKEDHIATLTFHEAESQILESKDRLQKLLREEDPHFIYLVGLVDNKIISFCDIHIGRNKRDKHIAEFGRSVLKEFRRTGAGTYLQQEAISFVKELGFVERINLHILSNNTNSIESCKSNGFLEISKKENEVKFEDGTYADLIQFTMDIR